jgi:hypothetical protein
MSICDHGDKTFARDVCEGMCQWQVGVSHNKVIKASSGQYSA